MQTEGGQKLKYRVQMYFEVLGGYRGQQHALSLWRAVRTMEMKINVKNKNLISDTNQINVNNTEVYIIIAMNNGNSHTKQSHKNHF